MVPWSLAPTSAPGREHAGQALELGQRVDLPGQVVEPDRPSPGPRRLGPGPDGEQTEVVVVGRARRLEEDGPGQAVDAAEAAEPQHLLVERRTGLGVTDVEDGVVESNHRHAGANTSGPHPVPPWHPLVMGRWAGTAPDVVWRRSQEHLLALAATVEDERWHLCAPPGAGKTLIGLELARRVDRPTLVLAPTTAIRDQWRDQTAHFGVDPAVFTSDDPDGLGPSRPAVVDTGLLAVTYQLLGNPGRAAEELRDAARRLWRSRLVADLGATAADERLRAVEARDPERAAKEVARHERELRRSLGTGEDVGLPGRPCWASAPSPWSRPSPPRASAPWSSTSVTTSSTGGPWS